jgi:hypothetical protein
MSITIEINRLSLCHRNSGGVSEATLPDVCETPPGRDPVRYPNVAYTKDLAKGTTTVFADGGHSIAHKPSELAVSTGDEPGTDGGVTSGTYTAEATWLTFSMDVTIEGESVCRHTDKMLHNHGNTINAAGCVNPPVDGDCDAMWKAVDEEVWEVFKEEDHQKRNVMITQKYAELYKSNPDFEWAGLAGAVSKHAGCMMKMAQEARGNILCGGDDALGILGGGDAKDAYDALGESNRSIFENIYTNHRFYACYGWDAVERCANTVIHRMPDKLKEAFRKMEDAKSETGEAKAKLLSEASRKIAEHEQLEVVEQGVYYVRRYKEVLLKNEAWAKNPIGRMCGATLPYVAFSAKCGEGTLIHFDGSIVHPPDRVSFYVKIMAEWIRQRDSNPAQWAKMYEAIIAWAKGGGG